VSLISSQSFLIALLSLVKVFIRYKLMPTKGMGVGKVIVKLNGPIEELEGSLMFLLQTVAVTDHAPRLRGK
jgi:hypothetical protein